MKKTLIFIRIAKMGTTELAKFCHSLPETELTRHCQNVQPKFGRTESSVDQYKKCYIYCTIMFLKCFGYLFTLSIQERYARLPDLKHRCFQNIWLASHSMNT